MGPLEIYTELVPGRVRLTLAGEIDVATAGVLADALQVATEHGVDVELHMAEVTFLDSIGLGAILAAWNAMPIGRALTIVEASDTVVHVIGITSLSSMFGMPVLDLTDPTFADQSGSKVGESPVHTG